MMSQRGKQTISIHTLPNILKNKDNHAMMFGHLIEYKMQIIFLKKSHTKCSRETIPRPFSKKSKFKVSLDR